MNTIKNKAIALVESYLQKKYSHEDVRLIMEELNIIDDGCLCVSDTNISVFNEKDEYILLQKTLGSINEKTDQRKTNGVYYTPIDIVRFILVNGIKFHQANLNVNTIGLLDLTKIKYKKFCFLTSIFDPTCGTGEFVLECLKLKLELLEQHNIEVTKENLGLILSTIFGNDIDYTSVYLCKMRIILYLLHSYGISNIVGIGKIINRQFFSYDYVDGTVKRRKYDVIVGNPPYVEDSVFGGLDHKKYGNIYANVLVNAAKQLNTDGVFGFIIPLSYISTKRMEKLREDLFNVVPVQYILSYADRPDCLFRQVHQKLNIVFAKKNKVQQTVFTSSYKYWYKNEREQLFERTCVCKNNLSFEECIPKIGNNLECSIFDKVTRFAKALNSLSEGGNYSVYLNMRATYWVKAFMNEHKGSEYKRFLCNDEQSRNLLTCILNSSLFWWFWVCISDCWHITSKELNNFTVPEVSDYSEINKLAKKLDEELENTKVYVGTKQTDYEYKHRLCINTIHAIDDCVCRLFNLTDDETKYIKGYSLKYRMGEG